MDVFLSFDDNLFNTISNEIDESFKHHHRKHSLICKHIKSKTLDIILENIVPSVKTKENTNSKFKHIITTLFHNVNHDDINAYLSIFNRIIPIITRYNFSTQSTTYVTVRNVIRHKYGRNSNEYTDSFKFLIDVNKSERIQRNIERENNKIHKKSSYPRIRISKIFQTIDLLRRSTLWVDNIIFVCLTSGSRFIEVLRESHYEKCIDGSNNKHIRIVGVAKKRDDDDFVLESRPLLNATANEIIVRVKCIRDEVKDDIDGKTNEYINDKFNPSVISRIKNIYFKNLNTQVIRRNKTHTDDRIKIGSHTMRRIYAMTSYILYNNSDDSTLSEFIAHNLGHDNTSCSNAYQRINIINDLCDYKRQRINNDVVTIQTPRMSNNTVEIDNIYGATIRFYRVRAHKDDTLDILIPKCISVLRHNNIKPTYVNIGKLGFSNNTIYMYKKSML